MKYDVHLYAVVRVKVCGVEAASQLEAIEEAENETDLMRRFEGRDQEYSEEISHYLVDEAGDEEHLKTRWYHQDTQGNLVEGSHPECQAGCPANHPSSTSSPP